MNDYDVVAKISIVPRGPAGGVTIFMPSEERLNSGLYSKELFLEPEGIEVWESTPGKINMEPENTPLEKENIFQTIILRFELLIFRGVEVEINLRISFNEDLLNKCRSLSKKMSMYLLGWDLTGVNFIEVKIDS